MIVIEDMTTRPELREAALDLGAVGGEFLLHDQIGLLAKATHLAARWPRDRNCRTTDGTPP